jgi:CDP-diacylglycerol---glycerol-3-phosphate 3-phosphatidyltransferase
MQVAMVFALILAGGSSAWVDALVYATVAVTVLSGVDYFFGLRRALATTAAGRSGPDHAG